MSEETVEALVTLMPPNECGYGATASELVSKYGGTITRQETHGFGNYSSIMLQIKGKPKAIEEIKTAVNQAFAGYGLSMVKIKGTEKDEYMQVPGQVRVEVRFHAPDNLGTLAMYEFRLAELGINICEASGRSHGALYIGRQIVEVIGSAVYSQLEDLTEELRETHGWFIQMQVVGEATPPVVSPPPVLESATPLEEPPMRLPVGNRLMKTNLPNRPPPGRIRRWRRYR